MVGALLMAELKNPMSIYEYKHVYNIFANTYILLVLENT